MAGWTKGRAQPGQVAETGTTVDTVYAAGPSGDNQYYPGYIPQRYIPPTMPVERDNAGEVGDGTVPDNTDRGNYGHGVIIDSHVAAKDHYRTPASDLVPQVMPEKSDQFEYEPIKVQVVGKDPDPIIKLIVDTYTVTPVVVTAQGTPTMSGQTPVRILSKDPRRKRALITISQMQGGSIPKIYPSSGTSHGFPITAANGMPLELTTTEEVWMSGSSATDSFTIAVLQERYVNGDRLYSVN